jgi:hypothetical protein
MKAKILLTLSVSLLPFAADAAQSIYCPQNAGYINVGMTESEVIGACGQPLSKQKPMTPIMQKVPAKQLIYTALNTGSVYPGLNATYYQQWSMPSGTSGINLNIQIINNKVSGVSINGSSTNAMSVCSGVSIVAGDSVNKVYSACGSPSMVNNTFINQLLPPESTSEVWVYQVDQYQAPISLTFVDGKLQSIN